MEPSIPNTEPPFSTLDIQTVAMVGAPNSGKTTLFNRLTGLRQKTGNFHGVTVERVTGHCILSEDKSIELIDLPGLHSLYPGGEDEAVTLRELTQPLDGVVPDAAMVVAEGSQVREGLLLASQMRDLGIRTLVAVNLFNDNLEGEYDWAQLGRDMETPLVTINARTGAHLDKLKQSLATLPKTWHEPFVQGQWSNQQEVHDWLQKEDKKVDYRGFLDFIHHSEAEHAEELQLLEELKLNDIAKRYEKVDEFLERNKVQHTTPEQDKAYQTTVKLDYFLLHPVWGYAIMLGIFFLLFQALFTIAAWPMDWIDQGMAWLAAQAGEQLPPSFLRDLLAEGLLPGMAGVIIFIPQIAILFFFISMLEETGYMARVMYLNDRFLRQFGLNGKSSVPLLSGLACAIPAIMGARTISDPRERLITILVTPFMGCSARLPVYTVLVAVAVPDTYLLGFIGVQGLVMFGLYFLGFAAAIAVAGLLNLTLKQGKQLPFILDLPRYHAPYFKGTLITAWNKSKMFVLEAGKIILIISLILWVASSFSPYEAYDQVAEQVQTESPELIGKELQNRIEARKLSLTYAGIMGRALEPLIEPLGFNWQMGIALVTSFAAREVFVGTLSTLFALGSEGTEHSLVLKLRHARDMNGEVLFDLPTTAALLIFYVLAMQCMSTFAIVKKETHSWKWPILQLIFMTLLAYGASWLTYEMVVYLQ